MSKQITGFVAWIRSFLDDVYANITHTHTKSQITDLAENVFYGTCSTVSTTQIKEVTVSNWSFTTGNILFVKFDDYNKYNGTAKISIGGTEKDIATVGTTKTSRYYWKAGEVVGFVYDGTNMVLLEGGTATTTYYGITKLSSSVSSTSEVLSATPNAVKQAYDLANAKQDTLISGTNIKTVNGNSLLGSGDVVIGGTGTIDDTVTQNSPNPVKSSGIYSALQTKQGLLSLSSSEIDEYGNSIFNDDSNRFYSTNDRIYHDWADTDELHFIKTNGDDVNFDDLIQTSDLLDLIYPVGSIYMSVNNASPQSLLGGTWVQLQDTFLYATSTTADANSTTATSGSADAVVVEHNHNQNAHNHKPNNTSYGFLTSDQNIAMTSKRALVSGTGNYSYLYGTTQGTVTEPNVTDNTTATNIKAGEDGTGKNMPPYMRVFMWKRTA